MSVDVELAEEIIRQMRFRGQGCVVSQACASVLCESAEGKSIEDLLKASPEELMEFEIRQGKSGRFYFSPRYLLDSAMSNTRNLCDNLGNAMCHAQNVYNDFAQLTQSYQAHGGTVNTGTTPQVEYSYADGSSNTIRITGMTYPNGRGVAQVLEPV